MSFTQRKFSVFGESNGLPLTTYPGSPLDSCEVYLRLTLKFLSPVAVPRRTWISEKE